jgi:hypothetical protein
MRGFGERERGDIYNRERSGWFTAPMQLVTPRVVMMAVRMLIMS